MDFGALQVQIFVSLALVLGAVFVSLLCDFLKGNNEALRERNIELVVRHEERERYAGSFQVRSREVAPAELAPPVVAAQPAQPMAAAPVAPAPAETKIQPEQFFETVGAGIEVEPATGEWATEEELSEIEAVAARIRESVRKSSVSSKPVSLDRPEERPVEELAEEEPLEEEIAPAEEEPEPAIEEVATADEELQPVVEGAESDVAEDVPVVEEPPVVEEEPERAVAEETAEDQPAPESPRMTLHAKVTPIDVIAAERAAASEAIKLARELERVAEATNAVDLFREEVEEAEEEQEELQSVSVEESSEREEEPLEEIALEENELPTTEVEEESEEVADLVDEVIEDEIAPEYVEEAIEEPAPEIVEAEEEQKTVTMPDPAVAAEERIAVPTGFQEYSVLAAALESDALFRGTIVAVSVNNFGDRSAPVGETLDEVTTFVESLMTASDFGCQSSADEFLLILPEELGAQAQRRLQYISQRLWDYQIRSVGTQTIMFSWGAAEISGEPLQDAIAAAKDRMMQTKRNRERASAEIHHYRVRAAND
jgi:hypothetical protein